MTQSEAKAIVKAKYPRAACFWYSWQGGFAVRSYRCGEPITNMGEPGLMQFKWRPVIFPTRAKAWAGAAEAVKNGTEGDLPK